MVLVGAAIVAVNIEGMTTGTAANGHEHDGTASIHLGLNHRSPLAIGIQGCTGIEVGLQDKTRCAGIVAEELEHVNNILCIINTDTATISTIGHLFGLSHIAHQCCHSIALSSCIAAAI